MHRISQEFDHNSFELHKSYEKGFNFTNLSSKFNNRVFPLNIDKESKFDAPTIDRSQITSAPSANR